MIFIKFYDIKRYYLIISSLNLIVSMIPYHYANKTRQKHFYIRQPTFMFHLNVMTFYLNDFIITLCVRKNMLRSKLYSLAQKKVLDIITKLSIYIFSTLQSAKNFCCYHFIIYLDIKTSMTKWNLEKWKSVSIFSVFNFMHTMCLSGYDLCNAIVFQDAIML